MLSQFQTIKFSCFHNFRFSKRANCPADFTCCGELLHKRRNQQFAQNQYRTKWRGCQRSSSRSAAGRSLKSACPAGRTVCGESKIHERFHSERLPSLIYQYKMIDEMSDERTMPLKSIYHYCRLCSRILSIEYDVVLLKIAMECMKHDRF